MIRGSAQLWIGANRTPPGWIAGSESYEGILDAEVQIGGMFCHHAALFGVVFDVPRNDPLAEFVDSYYGTSLPGHRSDGHATGLDVVIEARERLRALDLDLDRVRYFHLAEAYVPLDAERAWNYAARTGLKMIVGRKPDARERISPATLGLSQWSVVAEYLEAAWLDAAERSGSERAESTVPQRWLAALVSANSD